MEEIEEREQILQEAMALKKLAVDYAHPELPVVTTDATASGRNYFDRASAPEQESMEEIEEREQILEDLKALKKLAVEYLHPELPVVTTDSTASGRNYFDRASAPEQETMEEIEEREQILQEAMALKKFAVAYAHPELPVVTTDSTASGRNYFDRASAPEQESLEEAEERALLLADAMNLKKFAIHYLHPELPVVTTDSTASGRNYFDRASAPEQESLEEAEERALLLADAMNLKKFAIHYLHPELPVVTTDSTATGRNYYVRASAPGHNYISTTSEDPFHSIDYHGEHLDDHDSSYGNFDLDEDMYSGMRHQLHHALGDHHFHGEKEHHVAAGSGENSEDEGKLSRSPSSVMLFGAYEETA